MQVQNRLVSVPTRQIALGAALVVAVALLVLVLLAGTVRSAPPPATAGTHVVIANEQAPDAQERNDMYSRALAAQFNNQSPDAQERNIQLSGR